MPESWKNKLFFGDNLKMLREEIDDESVDLVYLDPPFNSNASSRGNVQLYPVMDGGATSVRTMLNRQIDVYTVFRSHLFSTFSFVTC